MNAVAAQVTVPVSPPRRRLGPGAEADRGGPGTLWSSRRVVALACVTAWALLVGAELSGLSVHFRHDAVAESGRSSWLGTGLFLVGWVAMVAAMMLPATAPVLGSTTAGHSVSPRAVGAFLGGFAAPWAAAGVALLSFDIVLHQLVHSVPALEARPWVIAAALLGLAGLAQLAPSTRRLTAGARQSAAAAETAPAFADGAAHGVRCLRADGPLMFVMFALGASLGWMAALTGIMVMERSSRSGPYVAALAGAILVFGAVLAVVHPASLPAALVARG